MAASMPTPCCNRRNIPDFEVLKMIEDMQNFGDNISTDLEVVADLEDVADLSSTTINLPSTNPDLMPMVGPEIQENTINNQENSDDSSSSRDPSYVPSEESSSEIDTATSDQQNTLNQKQKGKKRLRNDSNWPRNKRKQLRNKGLAYDSVSGKSVAGKTFKPLQDHVCRLKCTEKVPDVQRQEIFKNFWAIGDFDQQNAYLCGTINAFETKQHKNRNDSNKSRRAFSRSYNLTTSNGAVSECKSFFLDTLQISNGRVNRALKKQLNLGQGIPTPDHRGKHKNRKTLDADRLQGIIDHINSFPKFESHYTRSHQRDRKYLAPDLTVTKMYSLYSEECEKNGIEPLKEWAYRHTFTTKFNLSFHPPRKDTCKTCDTMKMKIDTTEDASQKRELENLLELHHRKAEKVRESLRAESEKVKQDMKYDAFTFDLEKTLPTPYLSTGIVYYKRQLWTYNLGIHSMRDNKASMFMWDEATAKRGANEIGSCIYKNVKQQSEKGVDRITAYSDSCGGQNRNIKMAWFWSHIVATLPIVEINHKFMVSGHSYLPNDQDFGVIERKRIPAMHIYVPNDWMELVSQARKQNPFKVVKMEQKDFLDSKIMSEVSVNRKKCTDGESVNWLKIHWIRFKKETPLQMELKYNIDEDAPFYVVDLERKERGTRGRPKDAKSLVLPQLYNDPIPINPAKLKDLKDLLPLVPPIHHQFYTNMMVDENVPLRHPEDISDYETDHMDAE